MAKIHVLDSETIDKIAAGEVVERPSSVVKELVENAIDANAGAVTVEVKEGGIEFIRVTDNGSGMERSELRKAFLRHATSKILQAEDLNNIKSLGFRGEALSSIAAVSKVEVITKREDELTGSRIVLEGGVEKEFDEVGAPDGTTFIMRNLFFNTPVRRKFLKQPATEGGYIADLMEHMALSRPDISFKLILGGRTKFHTSGNGDLREVIYRIYGRDIASNLVPIQTNKGGISIEGYLGKPVIVRSNKNFEIYYINGRFIKSNIVSKAIEEGYKEYLMQHKFPLCVLHIAMDLSRVDVNVHPSKMDVRFFDGMEFTQILSEAVRETLKKNEMIPDNLLIDEKEEQKRQKADKERSEKQKTPEPFELNRYSEYLVKEEMEYRDKNDEKRDFASDPVWNRAVNSSLEESTKEEYLREESSGNVQNDDDFFVEAPLQDAVPDNGTDVSMDEKAHDEPADDTTVTKVPDKYAYDTTVIKAEQLELFEEKLISVDNRSKFNIIGQVFDTYWIVQFEDKMFIIDQHAAHEKVKYERLMKRFREKEILSQTLMPPVIVTLSAREEAVLNQYMNVFESLGFGIEDFGGAEYTLRSVPVDLYGCSERELFLSVLDELLEMPSKGSFRVIEEKIASMSCKAAVKGNSRLSGPEAEKLIDELLTLENPYNCPHGRPTMIIMPKTDLEKKFKRII